MNEAQVHSGMRKLSLRLFRKKVHSGTDPTVHFSTSPVSDKIIVSFSS